MHENMVAVAHECDGAAVDRLGLGVCSMGMSDDLEAASRYIQEKTGAGKLLVYGISSGALKAAPAAEVSKPRRVTCAFTCSMQPGAHMRDASCLAPQMAATSALFGLRFRCPPTSARYLALQMLTHIPVSRDNERTGHGGGSAPGRSAR